MKRFFRLLRIIYLIQTYPGIKAKELAAYCETSERTIYRDLNILSEAHVPMKGKIKGIVLLEILNCTRWIGRKRNIVPLKCFPFF